MSLQWSDEKEQEKEQGQKAQPQPAAVTNLIDLMAAIVTRVQRERVQQQGEAA